MKQKGRWLPRLPYLQYLRISPGLKTLVTPVLIHEIDKVVLINEAAGPCEAAKEEEKDGGTGLSVEEGEKEDFRDMECSRCGFEAQLSKDLIRSGENLIGSAPTAGRGSEGPSPTRKKAKNRFPEGPIRKQVCRVDKAACLQKPRCSEEHVHRSFFY